MTNVSILIVITGITGNYSREEDICTIVGRLHLNVIFSLSGSEPLKHSE